MDLQDSGQASPGDPTLAADAGIDPLIAALTRPIVALETRYRAAGRAVTDIIQDLNRLSASTREQATSPPPTAELLEQRPPLGRLQVTFDDEAVLLDFQAAVAALPGVQSVTTLGNRGNQLTLLVELGASPVETAGGPAPASSDSGQPTQVCTMCGRILVEGGPQVSHGLCPACAARFQEMRPR